MSKHLRMFLGASAAALALAALPARAAEYFPPGTVLEGSVETSTESVIFPQGPEGRLQVSACGSCLHPVVQLDAHTQFLLGGELVSLRDMQQYALRNPGHALTIHYRLKDTVASRVTVLVR